MNTSGHAPAPTPVRSPVKLPKLGQGQRRNKLAALIALALLQAAVVLVGAVAARALLARGPVPDNAAWPHALWLLALAVALAAWLRFKQAVLAETLAQAYVARVRLALFNALVSLSPASRHRRSRGSVLLRFIGDAQALRRWVGDGLPSLVVAGVAWPTLLSALAVFDGRWAMLALAWSLVALVGMALTLPGLTGAVRAARWAQAVVASKVHDQVATLPALQAAAQGRPARRTLARRNRRLALAMVGSAAALGRHRLITDLALGGLSLSVLALWLHGADAKAGALAGGGAVFGALGLIALVAAPLRRTGRALAQRAAAQVARERLVEFLNDAEHRPERSRARPEGDQVLAVEGWALPHGAEWCATVAPGRCIALVGPAGCGKTTLLEALAGVQPDGDGVLTWGGVPLAELRPEVHAALVGFVSAQWAPSRGSVGSNLRERCPDAALPALAAACTAAGWPHGLTAEALDAAVRDDGSNLCGTERRSLLLARALVAAPRLLLIDDIEHCLPGTARVALARLRRHHGGTLVFSTHEPTLAALADEVWDLGHHVVRRRGTPAAPDLTRVV